MNYRLHGVREIDHRRRLGLEHGHRFGRDLGGLNIHRNINPAGAGPAFTANLICFFQLKQRAFGVQDSAGIFGRSPEHIRAVVALNSPHPKGIVGVGIFGVLVARDHQTGNRIGPGADYPGRCVRRAAAGSQNRRRDDAARPVIRLHRHTRGLLMVNTDNLRVALFGDRVEQMGIARTDNPKDVPDAFLSQKVCNRVTDFH